MSVTSALYTGISGLNANGEAMSVIGNNISNVNTIGFKQGRMLFSDVLSSSVSRGSQIGRGVQIEVIDNQFTQGSFESTESATDLAVQGDAFFAVKNSNGQFYTRAGSFHFDKDKILVNPAGDQVMGYGINQATGLSNGTLDKIDLTNFASAQPQMTSLTKMVLNLDATAATPTAAWDPANPVATSNFSSSISVFDSQGNAHTATVYFRKAAANSWDWHAIIPDATAGSPIDGTLTFNASGMLTAQTPAANANQNVTFGGGVTAPQPMAFDFGVNATTQYASSSLVSSQSQDGYAQGNLVKITVDDKGYVNGIYSNGQLQKLAQVALARFSSPNGLSKIGGSLFQETADSGQPQITNAATPGVGKIFSNSLEQSNVDMAAQFVKMITTQRGYSANSKTITTTDEMLQEVLGLKR